MLFSDVRYELAKSGWRVGLFHARADNVGYRDQRYFAELRAHRPLRDFRPAGMQIPQFYSVDTMTPYTGTGGTLVLDDATQRAIQNGDQAKLNLYVPLAPAFDLRERRDIGRVDVVATPKPNLDVTASFTTQKHSGELPWGASFGFSNDVEVALPYDSRANDLTIGTEWTNARNMLRVAYSGSWFDNIAPTLTWDSPLRLDDASGAPGTRTHVPLAVELGPDHQLRRLHQAGAQDAGDWLLLLRIVEQRRAAAALHDQRGAAADRAAPRDHRGGSARLLDQPEPHLAPVDRLAVQRARAQLHLRQPHAGDVDHGHGQLRRLGRRRRQPAVRISTRTAGRTSTATPRGRN